MKFAIFTLFFIFVNAIGAIEKISPLTGSEIFIGKMNPNSVYKNTKDEESPSPTTKKSGGATLRLWPECHVDKLRKNSPSVDTTGTNNQSNQNTPAATISMGSSTVESKPKSKSSE